MRLDGKLTLDLPIPLHRYVIFRLRELFALNRRKEYSPITRPSFRQFSNLVSFNREVVGTVIAYGIFRSESLGETVEIPHYHHGCGWGCIGHVLEALHM